MNKLTQKTSEKQLLETQKRLNAMICQIQRKKLKDGPLDDQARKEMERLSAMAMAVAVARNKMALRQIGLFAD